MLNKFIEIACWLCGEPFPLFTKINKTQKHCVKCIRNKVYQQIETINR